jgi:hypothetical protein
MTSTKTRFFTFRTYTGKFDFTLEFLKKNYETVLNSVFDFYVDFKEQLLYKVK